MDVAVLGERLPEVTQKPFLGSSTLSLQCQHCENSKALAGLVFCEMLSQYPQSAFQGSPRVAGGGGSAAVCDPNPPRPFARSRSLGHFNSFCVSVYLGGRPLHNAIVPLSRDTPTTCSNMSCKQAVSQRALFVMVRCWFC